MTGRKPNIRKDLKPEERKKRRIRSVLVAFLLCAICAAVVAIGVYYAVTPINVTVNGQAVQVSGARTAADAIAASGISIKPGNLIAIDGSVIKEGEGRSFNLTVNGNVESDESIKLYDGDSIEVSDGSNIEESYTLVEEAAPFSATKEGTGAVHIISKQGQDGLQKTKTGDVSEIVEHEVITEPVNAVLAQFNIEPAGGKKVIALTFDDGPNGEETTEILDILKANKAKATFFTVGKLISGENVDIVKRAASEGHQICTHSYDHADGSGGGVDLGRMSKEEQIAEITKGYEAIQNATGAEASKVIRTPGGNFGEDVIANIGDLIESEIGWNIDTQDWEKPGTGSIVSQILSAGPGDIILMHDGGGDRSQTVEALREALPVLASQGFTFVTIDELMEYAPAS